MTEGTQQTSTETGTGTAPAAKAKKSPAAPGTKKPRAKKEGAAKSKRPPTPSRWIPKSAYADVESVAKSTGVSKFYLRGEITKAYVDAINNAIAGVNVNPAQLAANVLRAKLATLDVTSDGADDGTGSGPASLPLG